MSLDGVLGFCLRNDRDNATHISRDSEPIHSGARIVKFILSLSPEQVKEMADKVENIIWVTDETPPTEEEQICYLAAGLCNPDGVMDQNSIPEGWKDLLIQAQGVAALPLILDGTLEHLCEADDEDQYWSYYIDWNKQILEVYDKDFHVDEEIAFADLTSQTGNNLQKLYAERASRRIAECSRAQGYTVHEDGPISRPSEASDKATTWKEE